MKIVPAVAPPTTPYPATMPANGAAPDFEELLNTTTDLEAKRRERAFGFSELGMLAPHVAGALDASEAANETPPPTTNPRDEPVLTTIAAEVNVRIDAQPAARHADFAVTAFEGVGAARAAAPQAHSRLPMPGASVTPRIASNPAFPTEEQSFGRQSSKPSSLATRPSARPLSLVVTGENGAVQILAGAPELSPEARERLRKAADDLAALFGVSLTEVTLNGSALEPSFASWIGGRHGYLSR